MRVVAVSMMKNEEDVCEDVVRHMAGQGVDGIIVADNLSTDRTRSILKTLQGRIGCPLVVLDDKDPAYYQSRKMTALAKQAWDMFSADWIVPFDADELWISKKQGETVGDCLRRAPARTTVVPAHLYNYMPTSIDPAGDCAFRTIQWRITQPAPLPKVAFKWHPAAVIEQGNHGVTHPNHNLWGFKLEVQHFPWRTVDQYAQKVKQGREAYQATDLEEGMGGHWRGDGALLEKHGREALEEKFNRWFHERDPNDNPELVHRPARFEPVPVRG